MGLFINKDEHPEVYKNTSSLVEPNQAEFKQDYLSELLENYMLSNTSIHQSLVNFQHTQSDFNQRQLRHRSYFDLRLNELKQFNESHEKLEQATIDRLANLENQNEQIQDSIQLENNINQHLLKQVSSINHSQEEIVKKIDTVGNDHEEIVALLTDFVALNNSIIERLEEVVQKNELLHEKLEQQSDTNEEIITKVSCVEVAQKDVLNRVDQQEGLLEKIIRQIDNLRAILFERSHFIEEKVEKVAQASSSTSE